MASKKMIRKLIDAVIANEPITVNRLLNAGVDPNDCLDDALITPLHYAAQYNALDVVSLLMASGAEVSALTFPEQYTPLDIALMHEHYRIANLLLMYMRCTETLH